jgi:hypothetical protein
VQTQRWRGGRDRGSPARCIAKLRAVAQMADHLMGELNFGLGEYGYWVASFSYVDDHCRNGEAMPTRGEPNQGTGQVTSQGMSPMAKALLALLAIYAMKNMRRAGLRAEPAGRAPRRCQRRPARRRQQRWRARRSGVCSIFSTHSAEPPGIRVLVFMLQMSSELPPPPEHAPGKAVVIDPCLPFGRAVQQTAQDTPEE